jgi:hypothetical protein
MSEQSTEKDGIAPAEWGPLEKPYTYLPEYADVAYVDGKLSVARGILSRTTDPDVRRRWMQTVDILLAQRAALSAVIPPEQETANE